MFQDKNPTFSADPKYSPSNKDILINETELPIIARQLGIDVAAAVAGKPQTMLQEPETEKVPPSEMSPQAGRSDTRRRIYLTP